MKESELVTKIRTHEFDINSNEAYFPSLIKALLYDLNHNVQVRGVGVPHYILNTGDDTLWREAMGHDSGKEPCEVSGEDWIYTQVPRCLVHIGGINMLYDQLTSPYTLGDCQVEWEGSLWNITCEFRRMPITMGVTLKYVLDSYTDALSVVQQMVTKLATVKTFPFVYLGQTILATYKVPTDNNIEYNVEFDGETVEDKQKTIAVELEIETNIPVYYGDTAMDSDNTIKITQSELGIKYKGGTIINDTDIRRNPPRHC